MLFKARCISCQRVLVHGTIFQEAQGLHMPPRNHGFRMKPSECVFCHTHLTISQDFIRKTLFSVLHLTRPAIKRFFTNAPLSVTSRCSKLAIRLKLVKKVSLSAGDKKHGSHLPGPFILKLKSFSWMMFWLRLSTNTPSRLPSWIH